MATAVLRLAASLFRVTPAWCNPGGRTPEACFPHGSRACGANVRVSCEQRSEAGHLCCTCVAQTVHSSFSQISDSKKFKSASEYIRYPCRIFVLLTDPPFLFVTAVTAVCTTGTMRSQGQPTAAMSRAPSPPLLARRRCFTILLSLLLATTQVRASLFSKLTKLGSKESDEEATPDDAALVYGHKKLASTPTLAEFSTEPAFPTAETLFLLGRAHDEGREDVGIKRNEDAARELYESAAKLGYPEAQHALSVILASSGEDEVEAILYDFFASLGGDPLAHAALGYRYLYG